MSKVRVDGFSISLDGFGAGIEQSAEAPLGIRGTELHSWLRETRTFHTMIGTPGGTTGTDDGVARHHFKNIGAVIMGRNMFGPIRGEWKDHSWNGWWGPNPPFHVPVFILTNFARPDVSMDGGTTFFFSTEGIEETLARAKHAAGGQDVLIAGGVSTVRQYLQANLIDEMHLAISPALLGRGEHLMAGLDLPHLGFQCTQTVNGERAHHVFLTRSF